MATYTMVHGSTEYRRILVTATTDAGVAVDPTAFPVHVAFTLGGAAPGASDWNAATWVTVSGSYYAKILVGPDGGVSLTETDYTVWVKVDAGIEYPYLRAGTLVFM